MLKQWSGLKIGMNGWIKMQLTEQHIIHDDRFREWCVKAKNLYNQSLYYWRQSLFGNIERFTEYELSGLYTKFNEETYRALPIHTSQQIIKFLFSNIKGWDMALKEYLKEPYKFSGKPGLPKYKKELSELYFTNKQVKLKNGFVCFPKILGVVPIKTNITNINHCRVIPKANHFVVEFVYTIEEKPVKEYDGNWMGVDVGLNNLTTCVTKDQAFIINGKPLKAINNYYNKRKRVLQSKLKQKVYTSKRIERLTFRRTQKTKDYLHKASRLIVDKAKELGVTKIIIGKNENWKQNINLGKKTNREFVSIPHATLIEKIKYKALLDGIETLITQEAYTSKCSALDLEEIRKHETYVGKRKKRGLFVTADGSLVNADANGALNIARLGLSVSGDEITISESVRSAVVAPNKMDVLHDKTKSIKSF